MVFSRFGHLRALTLLLSLLTSLFTTSVQADDRNQPGNLTVLKTPYLEPDGKLAQGEIQIFEQGFLASEQAQVVAAFRKQGLILDHLFVVDPDDLDYGRKFSSEDPLPDSKNVVEYVLRKISPREKLESKTYWEALKESHVPPNSRARKLILVRTIFGSSVSFFAILTKYKTPEGGLLALTPEGYARAGVMALWNVLYRSLSSHYGEVIGKRLNFKSMYVPRTPTNRMGTLSARRFANNFTYESLLSSLTLLVLTGTPGTPHIWEAAGLWKLFGYGSLMTLAGTIYGSSLEGISQAGRDTSVFVNGDLYRYERFKEMFTELVQKKPSNELKAQFQAFSESLNWIQARQERQPLKTAVAINERKQIMGSLESIRNQVMDDYGHVLIQLGYSTEDITPTPLAVYERLATIGENLVKKSTGTAHYQELTKKVDDLKTIVDWLVRDRNQTRGKSKSKDTAFKRKNLNDIEAIRSWIVNHYEKKLSEIQYTVTFDDAKGMSILPLEELTEREIQVETVSAKSLVDDSSLFHRYRGMVASMSDEELAHALERIEVRKSKSRVSRGELAQMPVNSVDFRRYMQLGLKDSVEEARFHLANHIYDRTIVRAGGFARDKVGIWVFFATSIVSIYDLTGATDFFREAALGSGIYKITNGNIVNFATYLTAAAGLHFFQNGAMNSGSKIWNGFE
ncbi:MAG: hypothetical protein EOP09_05175, partial [Proteobacteria bacterium]